jgi:hypothetical protein
MNFSVSAILAFVLITVSSSVQALPLTSTKRAPTALLESASQVSYDFSGTVRVQLDPFGGGCSGAVVRFENSKDSDTALMLTNGHCVKVSGGMMKPNTFITNKSDRVALRLSNADGSYKEGRVFTSKIIYATMTGTDAALYTMEMTFAELKAKHGVEPLLIDSKRPIEGQDMQIISGFWKKGFSCKIDGFVYKLSEAGYESTDSIRYTKGGCETYGGTSGSPIVSPQTRLIIGINNTGNEDGKLCTMNNPCEVDANGQQTADKGRSYGQQVYQFYSCLNSNNEFDLNLEGCKLFH